MTFILVWSVIVNMVAIFAIFVLYARQNKLLSINDRQQLVTKEIEEIISTFLVEMKEENEEIKRIVEKKLEEATAYPPAKVTEETEGVYKPMNNGFGRKTALSVYKNQTTKHEADPDKLKEKQSDQSIPEPTTNNGESQSGHDPLYLQALHLRESGKTTEQIAKELNRGKTEIELWFKLYSQ